MNGMKEDEPEAEIEIYNESKKKKGTRRKEKGGGEEKEKSARLKPDPPNSP